MNVKLIAIAALGKNREIGLNGSLPWSLPAEYRHFKSTVFGKYVLMGRKNFEAHGCKVEGAHPIVLTRDRKFAHENALVFNTIQEALGFMEESKLPELYVIGGAEIYQLALPFVCEFLWTEVDYQGPADTFFPDFSPFVWTIVSQQVHAGWKLRRMIKIPQKLE